MNVLHYITKNYGFYQWMYYIIDKACKELFTDLVNGGWGRGLEKVIDFVNGAIVNKSCSSH